MHGLCIYTYDASGIPHTQNWMISWIKCNGFNSFKRVIEGEILVSVLTLRLATQSGPNLFVRSIHCKWRHWWRKWPADVSCLCTVPCPSCIPSIQYQRQHLCTGKRGGWQNRVRFLPCPAGSVFPTLWGIWGDLSGFLNNFLSVGKEEAECSHLEIFYRVYCKFILSKSKSLEGGLLLFLNIHVNK